MPPTTASKPSNRQLVLTHSAFQRRERCTTSGRYHIFLIFRDADWGKQRIHCWGHTWTDVFKEAKKAIERATVDAVTKRISQ